MSYELSEITQEELNRELTNDEQRAIAEANFLARQLYNKYHALVEYYKTYEKLSTTDALAKAESVPHESYLVHLQTKPAKEFTWWDINTLPADRTWTIKVWEEIKETAREDVLSGNYAFSNVLEKSPYEHAIYLAIRGAFAEQWNPQSAGEQLLVDQLAQMYCEYLFWLHRLEIRTNIDREVEDGNVKSAGKWKPALEHSSTPDWIETTSNMIERFHRLFLRTLRAARPAPLECECEHQQRRSGEYWTTASERGEGSESRSRPSRIAAALHLENCILRGTPFAIELFPKGGGGYMADQWLTIEQASGVSKYHAEHLRELLREGKIKGQKFGIVWQVSKQSLLAYVKAAAKSDDRRRGGRSNEET